MLADPGLKCRMPPAGSRWRHPDGGSRWLAFVEAYELRDVSVDGYAACWPVQRLSSWRRAGAKQFFDEDSGRLRNLL